MVKNMYLFITNKILYYYIDIIESTKQEDYSPAILTAAIACSLSLRGTRLTL